MSQSVSQSVIMSVNQSVSQRASRSVHQSVILGQVKRCLLGQDEENIAIDKSPMKTLSVASNSSKISYFLTSTSFILNVSYYPYFCFPLSTYLSNYLSAYLSIYLSIYLPLFLLPCLSISQSISFLLSKQISFFFLSVYLAFAHLQIFSSELKRRVLEINVEAWRI